MLTTSSDHSLNITSYRWYLAARPGEVFRADAPELWRRRAAPHALRGRRLVPVREARAAVQAVARARVHVAELPAEHRVVAHAARLAVGVLLAPKIVEIAFNSDLQSIVLVIDTDVDICQSLPSPMTIQLGAVARPRLLCNFLTDPVHFAEPFATLAGGGGGSAPQAEGILRA